jgi:hypothetical protein
LPLADRVPRQQERNKKCACGCRARDFWYPGLPSGAGYYLAIAAQIPAQQKTGCPVYSPRLAPVLPCSAWGCWMISGDGALRHAPSYWHTGTGTGTKHQGWCRRKISAPAAPGAGTGGGIGAPSGHLAVARACTHPRRSRKKQVPTRIALKTEHNNNNGHEVADERARRPQGETRL